MGLFSWLAGSTVEAAGKGAGEVLNGVGDAAIKLRSAITGSLPPEKQAEVETLFMQLDNALLLSQNELNKLDAQSGNLFKGGWRPAIGWVCATSLAVYYIPRFVLGTFIWFLSSWKLGALQPMPEMGIQDILGLVAAMLGLAGLRSYDKKAGIA